MGSKIDFVVTWVDSKDKKWQNEKKKYFEEKFNSPFLNDEAKYRDWDFFKFWFRAVESNAPWVNKIYVVTSGQIPTWLNTNHEKISLVEHGEIMPQTSLPTFNSQAIELCLNNIKGLSDNFVYFNDDMFINDKVVPTDFFYKNLPKDYGLLNVITPHYGGIEHAIVNNLEIINKYFDKKQVLKKNFLKFYSIHYGLNIFRNALLSPWKEFTGFYEPHSAVSINKNFYDLVWSKEYFELNKTVHSKFRNKEDLNFWLIRYWQLCSGHFYPQSKNFAKMFILSDNNQTLIGELSSPKYKIICLNDSDNISKFHDVKEELLSTFKEKYPHKSQFEK